uniref:NADP-dependent oxidoreductase n=1 Tax=Pedobacter schmidteae TaxID=2201271 RepID=UPI000EB4B2C3|nr:NADP-dependent oxidoreductase [Pedobacter schmidteae]
MKAIVIKEFGSADKLEIVEMTKPVINDDQVLIKVRTAGINPVDTKIRSGAHISSKTLQLPAVLGKDVSGIIELVGKNVREFKAGDAVFGIANGAYAEYAVANPDFIVKKPENTSFEEAGAISLVALTAWQAIYDHLRISSGQHVLIQSAAGGVGHLAVQFARIAGATVSGTASEKNIDFIKQLGVDQAIDYKNEKFEDVVGELDAAMDTMGGEILYRTISCVKPGGRVVCLPSSTKDDPKALEYAKKRDIELIWFMMTPTKKDLRQISSLLAEGKLKVSVEKVLPMEKIMQAHQEIEAHGVRGKIVIEMP